MRKGLLATTMIGGLGGFVLAAAPVWAMAQTGAAASTKPPRPPIMVVANKPFLITGTPQAGRERPEPNPKATQPKPEGLKRAITKLPQPPRFRLGLAKMRASDAVFDTLRGMVDFARRLAR